MKNISKFLIALFICLTFLGCNEEKPINLEENNLLNSTEIQEIGRIHNEALESVLTGLKKSEVLFTKDNISGILNNELDLYFKTIFDKNEDLEITNFYSIQGVTKYSRESILSNKSNLGNLSPLESAINENKEHFSAAQIELLTKFSDLMKSASNDFNSTITALEEIKSLAIQRLSEEEAQLVLIAVEVGKASLQYWDENFEEWQQVLINMNSDGENTQAHTKGWFSGSDVVGADIEGAVTGAVGAAIVNLAPGAGQVAYGTAIGGAAAGYSVGNAVRQIWNHFF